MTNKIMDSSGHSNVDDCVVEGILRIQSRWFEWLEEPPEDGDYDGEIVKTMVDTLDVHARCHLKAVEDRQSLNTYTKTIRRIGANLLENAEQHSVLSNPYSEEGLREIALSRGDLVGLALRGVLPDDKLQSAVDEARTATLVEAEKFVKWRAVILQSVEVRFEARYRHWLAEGLAMLRVRSAPRTNGADQPDEMRIADVQDAEDRRAIVDRFISDVGEVASRRITQEDIWTVAGYSDRTQFQRWLRVAPNETPTADRRIRPILAMTPEAFLRRRNQIAMDREEKSSS